MSSLEKKSETKQLLSNRSLMLFLVSRAGSALSSQMLAVAVGWQIYNLTHNPFYLGLVGLAQFLPMFLLTLVVGHTADRYNRKSIIRLCQLVQGLGTAFLAVGTFSGWLNKESILLTVMVIGAARAFESPTMQAMMPGLVSTELFSHAVAWGAAVFQTASIVGPALGGLLYAAGPTAVYAVLTGLFIVASLFISLIHTEPTPSRKEPVSSKTIFVGIRFIGRKPVILGAISLDLFAVLLGGATALLPVYAKEVLHIGSTGLGILRSAPSIGALLISIILARRPIRQRAGRIMFAAVIVFGLATIGFGLSHSFWLSLMFLAVLGAADVFSVVIRSSLVQMQTPDEMRGRVSAVNFLFIGTSNMLGEFESGLTAAWFGAVPAVLIGGIGTILVVLIWMRLFPALVNTDSLAAAES